MNVPPYLSRIRGQFVARRTPHFLLYTAHITRFALGQHWSLTNPMKYHFSIIRAKYLNERISAGIWDTWTIRYALYSTFAALYSVHQSAGTRSTLPSVKANEIPVFYFQG